MIALRTAVPGPVMREFVRIYAEREVGASEPGSPRLVEAIPARLEQTIEFQFGTPFTVFHREGYNFATPTAGIVGAQTGGSSHIELTPGVYSFGVFFKPTGFSRLFGLPVCELTDRAFDAALLLKHVHEMVERLAACMTFHERLRMIESALLPLAARAQRCEGMIAVAEHMFSQHGTMGVSQLARDAGLGVRQFERNFMQAIGVTPKRFARVARFQSALDAKLAWPDRSWLHIAHDLEYFDQMHMIRDFQSLGGETPTQLLSQLGDARPPALLAETKYK
jgi:AraC-like DNA-binding protein